MTNSPSWVFEKPQSSACACTQKKITLSAVAFSLSNNSFKGPTSKMLLQDVKLVMTMAAAEV
jgi:hypothetical protein